MRVSLIVPSFYPATVYGGPIFSTWNACKEMSKLSEVEIFVSTTNANGISKLQVKHNCWNKISKNFYVKYYDETIIGRFSMSFTLNIFSDIKKSDVVHIQSLFSISTPFAFFFAQLLNKPILFSPRGALSRWALEERKLSKILWISICIRPFSSRLTWHASSKNEKGDIINNFPNATVRIIPNGVSLADYKNINIFNRSVFMNKYAAIDREPSHIIISMGRIHKVKGFDILIRSFSNIVKKYPNAVLLIAGNDDGELNTLINITTKLNLVNKVFFIGQLSNIDKLEFFANSDLFVLPSHTENFGNVYIESLAAGTPIIASKNTPWESVGDANCGMWVENTVDDVSQSILTMLLKEKELTQINSRKFSKDFDWKNIASMFKSTFEGII